MSMMFPLVLIICSIVVIEKGEVVDSLSFSCAMTNLRRQHNSCKTVSSPFFAHHRNIYHHNHHSNTIYCNRGLCKTTYNNYHNTHSSSDSRLMSKRDDEQMIIDAETNTTTTFIDNDDRIGLLSSNLQSYNNTTPISTSTTKASTVNKQKWQANNFTNDYTLLKAAMARQSAMTNLQQLQRKYMLDYGFACNKRPLVRDIFHVFVRIGLWVLFLSSSGNFLATGNFGIRSVIQACNLPAQSVLHKIHVLAATSIVTFTTIHHWVVGMALPLLLLTLVKYNKLGPESRALDEYFKPSTQSSSDDDAPSFFYTSNEMSKKKAKDKDTGNFVLCLLENWSSAVIIPFTFGTFSILASLVGKPKTVVADCFHNISICTRLLTRIGAAAALHQYPLLLFELRRNDQPRPLCQSTTYMQNAVRLFLSWLQLCVASDLALLLTSARKGVLDTVRLGSVNFQSALSVIAPICHFVALGRIVRISKCSAVSLSESTTFPTSHAIEKEDTTITDNCRKVIWRYQLRWRTPVRLAETLKSWANYFFTGHGSLLFEMDDWKKQPLRFDDFSTEGTHYLMTKGGVNQSYNRDDVDDDIIPHADDIVESLSLIFRDRDAAIHNATQARLMKHQESYDSKTLNDVLGVAVQQIFDIGLSYDFDHFDTPADGDEISIHQLRARMAKSAIRRKRELDNAMNKELETLRRLKANIVTATNNKDEAEREMKSLEQDIRRRHAEEIAQMRDALLTFIPTNADSPKGTERYDNPILVAEYVDLKAPFEGRGELKETIGSAPDSLSMIENYVRNDFGDEAAEAYRLEEIAARLKEKETLSEFRERYGELKEDDELG